VLVKVPYTIRKKRNLPLFGLHATIAEVKSVRNRTFYRLKWIRDGLENERSSEMSKRLYTAQELKEKVEF
jgi:hypothetical protein